MLSLPAARPVRPSLILFVGMPVPIAIYGNPQSLEAVLLLLFGPSLSFFLFLLRYMAGYCAAKQEITCLGHRQR